MQNTARQHGRIMTIKGSVAEVLIERQSACSSCVVAAKCRRTDCRSQLIKAHCATNVAVGDEVNVVMSAHGAMHSVWLGYGIPLIAFVLAAIAGTTIGWNDGIVALAGFAVVALYYIILYVLRSKLESKFACWVEK